MSTADVLPAVTELDYIQTVATVAAAIGTIWATMTALRLSQQHKKEDLELSIHVQRNGYFKFWELAITNTSNRVSLISKVAWRVGRKVYPTSQALVDAKGIKRDNIVMYFQPRKLLPYETMIVHLYDQDLDQQGVKKWSRKRLKVVVSTKFGHKEVIAISKKSIVEVTSYNREDEGNKPQYHTADDTDAMSLLRN